MLTANVDGHMFDSTSGKLERRLVFHTNGIGAIPADDQTLAGEGELARLGPQRALGHNLVVDIQLERTVGNPGRIFVSLGELSTQYQFAGRYVLAGDKFRFFNTDEIVGVI